MSKKKDKQAEPVAADGALRLTDHPRAQRHIRRAKGWGGIVAFMLALWLSHGAGLTFDHMLERAIVAAVAGYVLLWGIAVLVWRHLAEAELEAARVAIFERLATIDADRDGGAAQGR